MLGFDTETCLITDTDKAPELVCASFADGHVTTDEREILARISDGVAGVNVAFDLGVIARWIPGGAEVVWSLYDRRLVRDLFVDARLLDIAEGIKGRRYSLADLAERYLGEHVEKADTWRLRYDELRGIPIEQWPAEAVEYSRLDGVITGLLTEAIAESPRSREEARAAWALHRASCWGLAIDREAVAALRKRLAADRDRAFEKCRRFFVGGKKNQAAIRDAIKRDLKRPPKTPGGAVSTSADTIAKCSSPDLKALVKYSHAEKMLSTYLSKLDVPSVHPRFYVLGAESGRTSCSGPNVQNLPREAGFRECFVARPGCAFVACDYSAQEMRTLAQACVTLLGHSTLAEAFRADRHFDPHRAFAQKMAGRRWDSVDQKALRQRAKAANFGFPGGMAPKAFARYAEAYGLDLSLKECTDLRDAWFAAWPEMAGYFRHIESLCKHGPGTLEIAGFRRGGLRYTTAANGYFQGLAAMASKAALYQAARRWPVVAFVHDEIIVEVPREDAERVAVEIAAVMVKAQEQYTPDVPAAAEATIMDRWSKDPPPWKA